MARNFMSRRSLTARIALWAAVFALVLRAGAPLLAAGAAQMRGVSVGEICSVYGVVLATSSDDDRMGHHDGGSNPDADHGHDHCALTALGALAAPADPPRPAASLCTAVLDRGRVERRAGLHDACAAWAARLGHGPPARA